MFNVREHTRKLTGIDRLFTLLDALEDLLLPGGLFLGSQDGFARRERLLEQPAIRMHRVFQPVLCDEFTVSDSSSLGSTDCF